MITHQKCPINIKILIYSIFKRKKKEPDTNSTQNLIHCVCLFYARY